jgi:HAE1 family hydrophobic/amphiphilic exporter-1
MNLPELSIRRPVLITCLFMVILALGWVARTKLPNALYPDVSFPVVNVIVPFPGAGPQEIETQVSKPLEDAMGSLPNVRELRSTNIEGAGIVTVVFLMNTDIRYAQQKVIEALQRVRGDLPNGIMEPYIRTVDPSDTPVVTLSLKAHVSEAELYDVANRQLRPALAQIPQVGLVELQGGRQREIHVDLDPAKLKARNMTAQEVVGRLMASGMDIPAGDIEGKKKDVIVRAIGQFKSLDGIRSTPVRFVGDEVLTTVGAVAKVTDGLTDEQNRVFLNGERALVIRIFRQSGGNTVAVSDAVKARLDDLNQTFAKKVKGFSLTLVRDGAAPIRDGVKDATDAIVLGVILTIVVVLFFLGSIRSTIITGLALPNSLLGSFLLMWLAGFSVNITTLAALSLAVGLLIDDAIVVRENIFRRIEHGEPPRRAAVLGTQEVTLAVVATTLTVLSVFGPVSFLQGIIGQFFREFGLTICFAMMISLVDSLTVAPMLSAYFAAPTEAGRKPGPYAQVLKLLLLPFNWLMIGIEKVYAVALRGTLKVPILVLLVAAGVFAYSFKVLDRLPKTFVPSQGSGEFQVSLETPAGTSLDAMSQVAERVDKDVRGHPEVARTVLTVGGENGERNQAKILVQLKQDQSRKGTTEQVKEAVRQELHKFPELAQARVEDLFDIGGGAGAPFVLKITGEDLDQLRAVTEDLVNHLKQDPDLKDVVSSYRPGAGELRVEIDPRRARTYGISSAEVGQELRILLSGVVATHFHEGGQQYDVRVRLAPEDRDLRKTFRRINVPNLNHRLLPLPVVAKLTEATSPAVIQRQDRERFIEVSADLSPEGRGLAYAIQKTRQLFDSGEVKLPAGVHYAFAGQTRDFEELLNNAILAVALSIGFMYLVLASLYESFFVPFSIMLVLPLAVCGAFYALALTGGAIDIYSMIGCILLFGVAAKNSILLVDYIHEGIRAGKDLKTAILHAGEIRVRPILMTSFALIAGMVPVAFPSAESAQQRTGMAIAVIGGIVSSTLLTLVVVPAAYRYILLFEKGVMFLIRPLLHKEALAGSVTVGNGPGSAPSAEELAASAAQEREHSAQAKATEAEAAAERRIAETETITRAPDKPPEHEQAAAEEQAPAEDAEEEPPPGETKH